MRPVSPVTLTLLFGAGAVAGAIEIARRLDWLAKASARHDRSASEWPSAIARLNGRLYKQGTRIDRLESEGGQISSRPFVEVRKAEQESALTASDLLAGMHSRYTPATLGGVTAVSQATGLCGVTLTTEVGDGRFLLTSDEFTKLVTTGAEYLARHHLAKVQSAKASLDIAGATRPAAEGAGAAGPEARA